MSAPLVVAAVIALLGAGSGCVAAARTVEFRGERRARRGTVASTPGWLAHLGAPRILAGVVVGFTVLLATRWLALSLAVAVLVVLWERLVHDRRADDDRRHVAAIAKWLEDLRDAVRASSVSAEEALELAASHPPAGLADSMAAFTARRRRGASAEDALVELAEDLAHPVGDAAITAIRMVLGGATGAARLHDAVGRLAAAARDEVRARERIDRTRQVYQSSMTRLVVIGAGLIMFLRWRGGDLLDPYGTPAGQLVLLVPVVMWAGCIAWLHRMCRHDLPHRHRLSSAPSPEPMT